MFLRALVSRHRGRKSSSNKMAAGLNQMVARQSKMAVTNHNTEHRVKTHTYISGSPHQTLPWIQEYSLSEHLLERHRTSDPSTNTLRKISQVFKGFKGRKGSQAERRRRRRERGAKGVALQTSPATCRHPGVTGLFPGLPEKGGLELGPTRNQTRKFEFSAKRRWSVSNPQLRLRPFD